jgi:hypothetical protein
MVYDLPVADEKVKPHQVTTLHMICALAFIVTGAIIVVYNYTIPMWGAAILCAGILLTVLVMAKNKWVISRSVNPVIRAMELLIAGCIAAYAVFMQWKFPAGIFGVLCAVIVFAFFWERSATDRQSVHLDKEGIKLPSTSRKRFKPWTEVEQVLLRFGILTINCTDNSLLQWNIIGNETEDEIFEAWCNAQVEENKSKRRNDDW